ncbi:50S ribosomal protein L30e-like protein [Amylocarpus encephaloides]|uniref:H/ACA ribonucleoprotein complex subunit 2 n=1 Tax=Amylocarpus encephaloides TaxID=45428 RepID=A0A9P7Y7N4_9HELO|nr:50S ribosomal protein L30e-like protein [Amylocarpus encephaloides]
MGKDKSTKDKKEKKEKRSEKDGVKKSKKDKKTKLSPDNITAAVEKVSKPQDDGEVKVVLKKVEDHEMEAVVVIKPVGALVPFANPLADEKVAKKVLKGVKKAAKNKTLKRGVKEVVKALRKSPQGTTANIPGIVILAADISPMDVISHIPVLCEDHNVPYIFVTSRAELGAAGNTKRPTSVVMVSEKSGKKEKVEGEEEFVEIYKDLLKVVEKEARNVRV